MKGLLSNQACMVVAVQDTIKGYYPIFVHNDRAHELNIIIIMIGCQKTCG